VEIDHAARRGAAAPGEGEVLAQAAFATVGAQLELVAPAQAVTPLEPRLAMVHRLAGIEGERRGIGLARILVELRPGQAERVLSFGLLQRGHDDAQARALGILAHELGAPLLAPARAVLAPAVAR